MGYSISTYLVAILGFSTLAAAIKVTVEPIYVNNVEKAIIFDVNVKSSDLVCNVTADSDNYKVVWRRNQTDVTEIATFKDRVFFPNEDTLKGGTMRIMRPTEDEVGNYTCVVISDGKEVANAEVQTFSNLKIKLSSSINVVESEKLRIHCFVIGKPIEQIWWVVVNDTEITETTGRYQLLKEEERDIENAILVIEDVQMFDRGEYKCVASGRLGTVEATTTIRVKDKYAALWPFLGICAEVFVLCAIILIYEKKRNKAELEESDTDQSPDQKNTPDHGKDSNLRHRQ